MVSSPTSLKSANRWRSPSVTSTEDTVPGRPRCVTTRCGRTPARRAQACAAQPVGGAAGEEISPVEDMRLTEDEGRVVGEWSVFTGTRAVRVFRIPLDEGGPITTDPRYQISITDLNLTGFVDADVPRGRRYLYRAQAEVPVGNQLRLAPGAAGDPGLGKLTSIADPPWPSVTTTRSST